MTEIVLAVENLLDSRLGKVYNDYLDIQGACIFLSVSKSTMYKLNHSNVICYYKPEHSKKCYYLKQDLIAYMTKNRLKSRQEINEEAKRIISLRKEANHVG